MSFEEKLISGVNKNPDKIKSKSEEKIGEIPDNKENFQQEEGKIESTPNKEKYKKLFIALTVAVSLFLSSGNMNKAYGMGDKAALKNKAEIEQQVEKSERYKQVIQLVEKLKKEQNVSDSYGSPGMRKMAKCLEYYKVDNLKLGDPQGSQAEQVKNFKGKLPSPLFGVYINDKFMGNMNGNLQNGLDVDTKLESLHDFLMESKDVNDVTKNKIQKLHDEVEKAFEKQTQFMDF
jgi:hypothetical protein